MTIWQRVVGDMLTWISRATGLGYRHPPPMVGGVVNSQMANRLKTQSDILVREVEKLERELRHHGIIIER